MFFQSAEETRFSQDRYENQAGFRRHSRKLKQLFFAWPVEPMTRIIRRLRVPTARVCSCIENVIRDQIDIHPIPYLT